MKNITHLLLLTLITLSMVIPMVPPSTSVSSDSLSFSPSFDGHLIGEGLSYATVRDNASANTIVSAATELYIGQQATFTTGGGIVDVPVSDITYLDKSASSYASARTATSASSVSVNPSTFYLGQKYTALLPGGTGGGYSDITSVWNAAGTYIESSLPKHFASNGYLFSYSSSPLGSTWFYYVGDGYTISNFRYRIRWCEESWLDSSQATEFGGGGTQDSDTNRDPITHNLGWSPWKTVSYSFMTSDYTTLHHGCIMISLVDADGGALTLINSIQMQYDYAPPGGHPTPASWDIYRDGLEFDTSVLAGDTILSASLVMFMPHPPTYYATLSELSTHLFNLNAYFDTTGLNPVKGATTGYNAALYPSGYSGWTNVANSATAISISIPVDTINTNGKTRLLLREWGDVASQSTSTSRRFGITGTGANKPSLHLMVQNHTASMNYIYRGYLGFNTSSISDTAVVDHVELWMYCVNKLTYRDYYVNVMWNQTGGLYPSVPGAVTDYNRLRYNAYAGMYSPLITPGAYFRVDPANTTVNLTGYTRYGLQLSDDTNNNPCTYASFYEYIHISSSEGTHPPRLDVYYHDPGPPPRTSLTLTEDFTDDAVGSPPTQNWYTLVNYGLNVTTMPPGASPPTPNILTADINGSYGNFSFGFPQASANHVNSLSFAYNTTASPSSSDLISIQGNSMTLFTLIPYAHTTGFYYDDFNVAHGDWAHTNYTGTTNWDVNFSTPAAQFISLVAPYTGYLTLNHTVDVRYYSSIIVNFSYAYVSDWLALEYYDGSTWHEVYNGSSIGYHFESITIDRGTYTFPSNMMIRFHTKGFTTSPAILDVAISGSKDLALKWTNSTGWCYSSVFSPSTYLESNTWYTYNISINTSTSRQRLIVRNSTGASMLTSSWLPCAASSSSLSGFTLSPSSSGYLDSLAWTRPSTPPVITSLSPANYTWLPSSYQNQFHAMVTDYDYGNVTARFYYDGTTVILGAQTNQTTYPDGMIDCNASFAPGVGSPMTWYAVVSDLDGSTTSAVMSVNATELVSSITPPSIYYPGNIQDPSDLHLNISVGDLYGLGSYNDDQPDSNITDVDTVSDKGSEAGFDNVRYGSISGPDGYSMTISEHANTTSSFLSGYFGYNGSESGWETITSIIHGTNFTLSVPATIQSITAKVCSLTGATSVRYALYYQGNRTLIASTVSGSNGGVNYVGNWKTLAFSSPPFVPAGDYILAAWGNLGAAGDVPARLNITTGTTNQMPYQALSYGAYPNPLIPSGFHSSIGCIYANYTTLSPVTYYDMDLEYQWTVVNHTSAYEQLVCYMDSHTGNEDLNLTYWNETTMAWEPLGVISAGETVLNLIGLPTSPLPGWTATYTIRLRGSDDTVNDSVSDTWKIDAMFIRTSSGSVVSTNVTFHCVNKVAGEWRWVGNTTVTGVPSLSSVNVSVASMNITCFSKSILYGWWVSLEKGAYLMDYPAIATYSPYVYGPDAPMNVTADPRQDAVISHFLWGFMPMNSSAPVIVSHTPANGSYESANVTLSVYVTDQSSDPAVVSFYQANWWMGMITDYSLLGSVSGSTPGFFNLTITPCVGSNVTWYVNATDVDGTTTSPDYWFFSMNNSEPSLIFNHPTDGAGYDNESWYLDHTLNFTVFDPEGDLMDVGFIIYRNNNTGLPLSGSSDPDLNLVFLSNGSYEIDLEPYIPFDNMNYSIWGFISDNANRCGGTISGNITYCTFHIGSPPGADYHFAVNDFIPMNGETHAYQYLNHGLTFSIATTDAHVLGKTNIYCWIEEKGATITTNAQASLKIQSPYLLYSPGYFWLSQQFGTQAFAPRKQYRAYIGCLKEGTMGHDSTSYKLVTTEWDALYEPNVTILEAFTFHWDARDGKTYNWITEDGNGSVWFQGVRIEFWTYPNGTGPADNEDTTTGWMDHNWATGDRGNLPRQTSLDSLGIPGLSIIIGFVVVILFALAPYLIVKRRGIKNVPQPVFYAFALFGFFMAFGMGLFPIWIFIPPSILIIMFLFYKVWGWVRSDTTKKQNPDAKSEE